MPVSCSLCGIPAAGDAPPLTWVWTVEDGEGRWLCEGCSRAHLRSMESKLDRVWW